MPPLQAQKLGATPAELSALSVVNRFANSIRGFVGIHSEVSFTHLHCRNETLIIETGLSDMRLEAAQVLQQAQEKRGRVCLT